MATNWRVYGSETVAAVLDKAELPGFYREAIVGPNEAALVIRNGKLEEVVTEVRLGTSGFRDRLKGLIGRESDAQVYSASVCANLNFSLRFLRLEAVGQ